MELRDKELTEKIIACAYKVHNTLGAGFLEKVYENAMAIEMERQALKFRRQAPLTVRYRDQVVGEYIADLLIEELIICELKAVETLSRNHEVQLVNYLVATGMDTGLLINFGRSVMVRRKFRRYKEPVNPGKSC
ncbi:MAG: GxxExxY protein [Pseudomonadota bacterium]